MDREQLADVVMRECRLRLRLEREPFRVQFVDTGAWGGWIQWDGACFVISLPEGEYNAFRIVWVICHEMRHAWQMCNGWLTYTGGRKWKGRAYQKDESNNAPGDAYNDAPDEIDANGYAETVAIHIYQKYVR